MIDLSLDDVAIALTVINANDRETWVQMGMAIKSEFGDAGFDVWDSWSQSAGNYDQSAARATWKSIRPGGGVGIGSLVHLAKAAGHQFAQKDMSAEERARREEEQKKRRAELEKQAMEDERERFNWHERVVGICRAIEKYHLSDGGKSDYLTRKKIKPLGIKFTKHSFIIVTYIKEKVIELVSGKEDINAFFKRHKEGKVDRAEISFRYVKYGSIAVPMVDENNHLFAYQFISETGGKAFMKFARKAGLFFWVGSKEQYPPIIAIAEGYATAASIHAATGWPAVVSFDAGNLRVVSEMIRNKFSSSRLVICGDDDFETDGNPGKSKAEKTANAVNGLAVLPGFAEEVFSI